MTDLESSELTRLTTVATNFLGAWNTQDVGQVLACYTADVQYRDPNTTGTVHGAQAMSRYLTKLFANWQMHWELRDLYPITNSNVDGAAVRWQATLRRPDGNAEVSIDGMDLVLLRDGLITHNEVQFDRGALLQLLSEPS